MYCTCHECGLSTYNGNTYLQDGKNVLYAARNHDIVVLLEKKAEIWWRLKNFVLFLHKGKYGELLLINLYVIYKCVFLAVMNW